LILSYFNFDHKKSKNDLMRKLLEMPRKVSTLNFYGIETSEQAY
jgi:hypothetical protein